MSRFEELNQKERDLLVASLDCYKKDVNPNPDELEKIGQLKDEIKGGENQ